MSQKAKNTAARLSAVQALYQASRNKQDAGGLVSEYLAYRAEAEFEGEKPVKMDGALFRKVVQGVYERAADLENVINQNLLKENKGMEPLLKAILLCASYELMAHTEVDAPIIINDYLNITHSFYEEGEAKLVNGVLDKISNNFRV